MALLDRIAECNNHDPRAYVPLFAGPQRIGSIRRDRLELIREAREVFQVHAEAVRIVDRLDTYGARSEALDWFFRSPGVSSLLPAWRSERFEVSGLDDMLPMFEVDRSAMPFLGARAFGVHVNGWVRGTDGPMMWVARRAASKSTYPGMLDNVAAGGIAARETPESAMKRECWDEAGIGPSHSSDAFAVSTVSYLMDVSEGLRAHVGYVFDLELPASWSPQQRDGEAESHTLWSLAKVRRTVEATREFKPNCSLVIIDFLLRHGQVPTSDPAFASLVSRLRSVPL
jgi:isopentenyldiphosphate isomerase